MAIALLTVKKEYQGKTYSNTYGVGWTVGGNGMPTDTQISAFAGPSAAQMNTTTTNPALPGYKGTNYMLAAVLGFERSLMSTIVRFTNVYLSDGKRQPDPDDPNAFLSWDLDFQGLRDLSGNILMPGPICLQVNRIPVGFSKRQGRLDYRGVLVDNDVRFGGAKLIDWTDSAARDALTDLVQDAYTNSALVSYTQTAGFAPAVYWGVPHYFRDPLDPNDPQNGTLVGLTAIADIAVKGPVNRQVKRGRKKKKGS